MKLVNKAGQPATERSAAGANAAEPVERRAGTKGNADQQSTRRTQRRISVSQALERIRQVLCRHTPEVGAVYWKAARTVLCGGREVKLASLPLYTPFAALRKSGYGPSAKQGHSTPCPQLAKADAAPAPIRWSTHRNLLRPLPLRGEIPRAWRPRSSIRVRVEMRQWPGSPLAHRRALPLHCHPR